MQKETALEEIFDYGFVKHTFNLTPKITVMIKTLTADDYLQLDSKMLETKGSKLYVMQLYGLHRLSHGLLQYRNVEFKGAEDAFGFIKSLPATVVDKMLAEQSNFEKTIKEYLDVKELEDAFFGKDGLQEKLEPSQKE